MEKEILTNEIIRNELKSKYTSSAKGNAIAILIIYIAFLLPHTLIFLGMRFWIARTVFYAAVYGLVVLFNHRKRSKINENKFYVFSDKLKGYKDEHSVGEALSSSDSFKYGLYFGSFEYEIVLNRKSSASDMKFYTWSKTMCMSLNGIMNTSLIGDEFYIVSLDNKKAHLVYNKKFFEYKK